MPVSVLPSRRDVLRTALALGAAALLPRSVAAADAVMKEDHLALLSDVHVSGGLLTGDMANKLSKAVSQVLALPRMPDRVLVAGDCAHLKGAREDYREFMRRISPLQDAKLPLHLTMGNHDEREHFWEALPAREAAANAKLRRQSMVIEGRQANWFMLDSLDATNKSPGELGRDQLEWLSAELDKRADKAALVMLHHDPVRDGKQGSLRDAEALLSLTRARQHVKALFFGHTHVWSAVQDRSGMHLVNLPATGYTLWMRSFLGWVDCRVYGKGAALTIHALNQGEKENGQVVWLEWRGGLKR